MKIKAKGFGSLSSSGILLDVHFYSIKSDEFDFHQEINKPENKKIIDIEWDDDELQGPIESTESAYLKLHLISHKFFKPNTLNLDGLFENLPNVAWTNIGPISIEDIDDAITNSKLNSDNPIYIRSLDKFPSLTDYIVPKNVRIADASRVRLGAYLSEGTTVMHEGFVNFNAGTLGNAMIEGRISAGVVVGNNSDLGGGCSTMGTLSGGNNVKISLGENCLLGANSGLGIPLGDNCTVEAGLYVTAGSKIEYDGNVVKGIDLAFKNDLLFLRHSQNGKVIAKPNNNKINLNKTLHKND